MTEWRVVFLFFIMSSSFQLPTSIYAEKVAINENLAGNRVEDISKIKKLIGGKGFLLFKLPKYHHFLEGYIRGIVTDYDGRPIEGVVVRAEMSSMETKKKKKKKKKSEEDELIIEEAPAEGKEDFEELTANFEAGITDGNGVYRIRFSVPILNRRVDARGKIFYNPGWEQQKDVLGQSYEPQQKETEFRLFYDEKIKILGFDEGAVKMVVRPVRNLSGVVSPIQLKGAEKPETAEPKAEKTTGEKASSGQRPASEKKKEEPEDPDFFKDFNFGP
ncbi:MAG: hypothetical protein HY401_04500 [Elusimicrobia bacterium]|nr:hypothetical protein [Elusimicrobiota bacterium]